MIPKKLFLTWHTLDFPPKMKENIERLINDNPDFKVHLFDDNMCREFIKTYYPPEVLRAFDVLIPGAYKSDLWRYCVLYIHGGIYMDIKLRFLQNVKLNQFIHQEWFVEDNIVYFPEGVNAVYNAFMVVKPGNEILKNCIIRIVENVKEKYYGFIDLCPTGPVLLGQFFESTSHLPLKNKGRIVQILGITIIEEYPEYGAEHQLFAKTRRYGDLWHARQIYLDESF